MILAEMGSGVARWKWGNPTFDGANNAVAEFSNIDGNVSVAFDENDGGGSVEMMISGKVDKDSMPTLVDIIRAYKRGHPDAKLRFHQTDQQSQAVSRYLQSLVK